MDAPRKYCRNYMDCEVGAFARYSLLCTDRTDLEPIRVAFAIHVLPPRAERQYIYTYAELTAFSIIHICRYITQQYQAKLHATWFK